MCGFLTSIILSVYAQLWFCVAVIVLSSFCYTLLALLTKKKNELLPCCYGKSGDEEVNSSLKGEVSEGGEVDNIVLTDFSETNTTREDSSYIIEEFETAL